MSHSTVSGSVLSHSLARRSLALVPLLLALALAGCADNRPRTPVRPGTDSGAPLDSATPLDLGTPFDLGPARDFGPTPPACTERAELVYVVDRDNMLARFDPRDGTFTNVGTISCASASLKPFSMSVDQDANAWVLFQDGQIRLVSTLDATCSPGSFPLADPFERFGMGFAAEGSGEALFVSGGTYIDLLEQSPSNPARLGHVTPATHAAVSVGSLTGWPELSGNASGQLFAFYRPDTVFSTVVPGRIVELNPANAAETTSYELTAMGGDFESQYAFAYWGSRFYVFIRATGATNSEVWRFNLPPDGDGTVTKVVNDAGRIIVGAGVSICAPITFI